MTPDEEAALRFVATIRAQALEEAAQYIDCGCSHRDAALAAESRGARWAACPHATCAAMEARELRMLATKAPP